jgi:hypothetical protein
MKPCLAWRNLESIALKRDAKYLLRSIIAPSADIEPKTSIMPEMTKPLSRREIRNLVAYLMTLRKPVILHAVSIEPLASRTPSGGGRRAAGLRTLMIARGLTAHGSPQMSH